MAELDLILVSTKLTFKASCNGIITPKKPVSNTW